jgi:type I restriction enzyme, S subunit
MTASPRVQPAIPEGWSSCELGGALDHVIDFRGRTPKKLGMEWGGQIPALSANNVKMGRIDLAEPTYFASEVLYHLWMTNGDARRGDVLLTMEAPLGNVAQVPDDKRYVLSQRVVLLRFDRDRLRNDFAYWQMQGEGFQRQLVRWSTGTTATGIQRAQLVRVPMLVPPGDEQDEISPVLSTLDAAIRRTEAVIAKLRAIRLGFVHDLLTRGIDENGAIRPAKQRTIEEPFSSFPASWQSGRLEEWLSGNPRNGYSPQAVEEWTGRVMLGLGCLTSDGFAPVQLKNAPRYDDRLAAAELQDGDLLLSRANTRELVGLAGIYRDVGHPCTYPDLMMRLAPASRTSAEFLELILGSPSVRRQIQAAAVGTSGSMVKVSGAIVRQLRVVVPEPQEQARIVAHARSIKERVQCEERLALKLRLLKKGLSEDLLTGRVRVRVSA